MTVENIIIKMKFIQAGFNKGMQKAQNGVNRLGTEMHHLGTNVNKSMNKAKQGINTLGKELAPFDKGMRQSMAGFQKVNNIANMSAGKFETFRKSLSPEALLDHGLALNKNGSYMDTLNMKTIQATNLQSHMTKSIATGGAKAANSLRMFTHGLRGFRMEALGVMFFGMMLANTFKSLLNPALEAYGVMELWKTMMLVVFIPIVDAIFPILLAFMEYFMNLPEPVQKLIGVFVILGYVFGQFLFILGTFTLGLGSLIFFWGLISTVVSGFLMVLLPLWMIFDGLIDVLTSVNDSFGNFIGILKILVGVIAIIAIIAVKFATLPVTLILIVTAIIYFLIGIFSWLWKRLPQTAEEGMDLLNSIISVGWAILSGIFGSVSGVVKRILIYLWDNIISKFKIGDKTLKEIIEDIKTKAIEKFNNLKDKVLTKIEALKTKAIDKFKSLKTKVLLKIEEMKTSLSTKFEALKTKFKEWGVSIVDNLVAGITKVKNKVVDAILSLFPEWAQDSIKAFGSFVVTQINKVVGGGSSKDTIDTVPGSEVFNVPTPYSHGDDFIWRSGSGMATINPNDTVVGYKGASPFSDNGGETNITNNFYGFTKEDLNRELDDRDSKIVNELQRLVKQ